MATDTPGGTPLYNFRIGPEAVWLIVNTVIGAVLAQLLVTDFAGITDYRAWLTGLGISAARTLIGAILAAATGGQFLGRGQAPTNHTTG